MSLPPLRPDATEITIRQCLETVESGAHDDVLEGDAVAVERRDRAALCGHRRPVLLLETALDVEPEHLVDVRPRATWMQRL